jgi:hypothetical protein
MCDQSQINPPGKENERSQNGESATSQETAKNPPITLPPLSPPPPAGAGPTPEDKGGTNEQKEAFLETFLSRHKRKLEAAAILAGLIVVGLNYQQWRDAHEQLSEMRRTTILDQRAWVVDSGLTANIVGDSIIFDFNYKNTGRTPAMHSHPLIVSNPDTNKIPKFDNEADSKASRLNLAPDRTQSISLKLPAGAIKSVGCVYLYGTVWYDDIFGKHHWIQFCYDVRCESNPTNFTISAGPIGIHDSCDELEKADKN